MRELRGFFFFFFFRKEGEKEGHLLKKGRTIKRKGLKTGEEVEILDWAGDRRARILALKRQK